MKTTIYIPDELFKEMEKFGLPISKVIQIAVRYYIDNRTNLDKKDGK